MEKRTTKAEYFTALRTMVENVDTVGEYPADQVLEFIDTQLAQIEAKAEKAKIKAAEKRAEGDALRAEIAALLTDEYQSADAITEAIDTEGVTKAKVVARLGQLVRAEEAEKELIKTDDNRKIMGYRNIQE